METAELGPVDGDVDVRAAPSAGAGESLVLLRVVATTTKGTTTRIIATTSAPHLREVADAT